MSVLVGEFANGDGRRRMNTIRRLSLFRLHRLLSDHGWEWKTTAPTQRHPIIATPRGKLYQIITAAPNQTGKALLIEPYQPPQPFKDTLL